MLPPCIAGKTTGENHSGVFCQLKFGPGFNPVALTPTNASMVQWESKATQPECSILRGMGFPAGIICSYFPRVTARHCSHHT